MTSPNPSPGTPIENLGARLLAADLADAAQAADLAERLAEALTAIEAASPAAALLRLAHKALRVAADGADVPPPLAPCLADAFDICSRDPDATDADTAEAMRQAAAQLRCFINSRALGAGHTAKPSKKVAAASCRPPAAATDVPAAVMPADTDTDLLREFVAESCDRLAAAEAALLALESDPSDAEQINTVLRAFHTIKGASGFLSLSPVEHLAHLSENLLIGIREGRAAMTGANADCALRCCDVLNDTIAGLPDVAPGQPVRLPKGFGPLVAALLGGEGSNDEPTNATDAAADAAEPPHADSTDEATRTTPQAQPESAEPEQPADTGVAPTASDRPEAVRPDTHADADSSVRVATGRLDELINMVGELVIAHSIIAQQASGAGDQTPLAKSVESTGRIVRELQALATGLRMVPLKGTFMKLSRQVRDLARRSGKAVRLETSGEETEIDRNMVEALTDPLMHMVRNAVDHGIEPASDRLAAGKPAEAVLSLRAWHAAGNVVIELSDDGRGLDRDAIIAKATDRGLLSGDEALDDHQAFSLIFHPGLSTAAKVTEVSGRGVGMDVVQRNIDRLHGSIDVTSMRDAGTTFTLRLPLTMAIMDAMLVRAGGQRFLLPTLSILQTFRPAEDDRATLLGRQETVRYGDELLPVLRIDELAGNAVAPADGGADNEVVVVVEGLRGRCALAVDEVLGQQQVVIKPLGGTLRSQQVVSGGAILGDGHVGLILDVGGLVHLARNGQTAAA